MRRLLGLVAVGLMASAGCAAWSVHEVAGVDVAALARTTPERTALMRQREDEARRDGRRLRLDARVVAYDRISPLLRRAVLVAEDDAFYSHGGLDWSELRAAARVNLERRRWVRGGSTITQQLAKNLYFGTERSLTRKLKEAAMAWRLERALSKRRIFELYLNRIEWGDGIFGAESASRRYFARSSSALTPRQALLLAAVIVNPRRFSVLEPSNRVERRVRLIAGRMRRRGHLTEEQYREALALPPVAPSAAPDSAAVDGAGAAAGNEGLHDAAPLDSTSADSLPGEPPRDR